MNNYNKYKDRYKGKYREDTKKPPRIGLTKERSCLNCEENFLSTGINNRLCVECSYKSAGLGDTAFAQGIRR